MAGGLFDIYFENINIKRKTIEAINSLLPRSTKSSNETLRKCL
jgi:uncharacterized protein (UPF0216 family)